MPQTDMFDCKLCRRSNNVDDMVFCAMCQEWYHYQCVGVTSAVANESWMCARCTALPSSTRLGELSGGESILPDIPVSSVRVSVSSSTAAFIPSVTSGRLPLPPGSVPPTISGPSGGINKINVTSSGLPLPPPPGLVPPTISGPSVGIIPASTATNYGQLLLTDQARASLQWVQEHRVLLERQMKESFNRELERKKVILGQLANDAMQAVVSGATSSGSNEQSSAVGINNMEGWLGRMIGEMENLSITPASAESQVTPPVIPVLNSSSTPTTAGSINRNTFDLSSLLLGVPSSMPGSISISRAATGLYSAGQYTTIPSTPLYEYSQLGRGQSLYFASIPNNSMVNTVPTMSLGNASSTNVVTACPTVPTASIPQGSIYGGSAVNSDMPRTVPLPQFSQGSLRGHTLVNAAPAFPLPQASPLQMVPTQQQLLARQVMPRDLPPFRGDPEDWPLFFSAYTNSTAACGYTNVENLARLQRALQGKAFDAVKSRLLLPACVPKVMSTLYMLYGRPELIIQTLLEKVRDTPAPKADRLETLITFGLAVQNLCDHIEATGQVAHLCNPVLLRELVDKIPAQQHLN